MKLSVISHCLFFRFWLLLLMLTSVKAASSSFKSAVGTSTLASQIFLTQLLAPSQKNWDFPKSRTVKFKATRPGASCLKPQAAFWCCHPGSLPQKINVLLVEMQPWKNGKHKGWTYFGPSTDLTGHFVGTCTIFSCNWRSQENILNSRINCISTITEYNSKSISP